MNRRTFITFLTYIGIQTEAFCCSEPWKKFVSVKELDINDEDFIETDEFLNLRYGKNNWKKDSSHSIYFEIYERFEGGQHRVGVGTNQPIKHNQYLELELVLERFIPYEGTKLNYHKQYGENYLYIITRENISNVVFGEKAIPYYRISTKEVLSKARVIAIYSTKNKSTKKIISRAVGISNVIKYVQPHCGGTHLIDDK